MNSGRGPILFLCAGNTCRSPMAEALWRRFAPGRAALSAGLAASDGTPASAHAVAALAEIGLDLSRHRSRAVRESLLTEAAHVIAMTAAQRAELAQHWPHLAGRIGLLDTSDIDDPFGGDLAGYRACRDRIERAVRALAARPGMA